MKTYLTRLSSSLVLALLAVPALAKPVAQVTEVSGTVFMVTADGKTTSLRANDHLEDKAEVLVEEGGSVTLNDYYDATYHLIGGTHLKIFNKSVQLKKGKTWIQSKTKQHSLALTTANGHVDYSSGEFISSFDQTSGRSQVLVVSGDVYVSNVLDRDLRYLIPAGSFTLVDPDVENGVPRAPTKVGLTSLSSALLEFKRLPEEIKTQAPARAIASVKDEPAKKGEIIFISTNRLPASVNNGPHKYFKKFKKTKMNPQEAYTAAPIKFYGVTVESKEEPVTGVSEETKPTAVPAPVVTKATEEVTPRLPASIPAPIQEPKKALETKAIDPEFANSLKEQSEMQPKYSKELDNLIHDLTSY